jgi:P27 family predicted phage terminase small subunit
VPRGVLSNLDFGVFTEWVILYDNLINVTMTMQKQGYLLQDDDDEIKPSKLAAEQRKIIALLHQLQSAMGFTPSSRSRVVSFAKENHTDNPFEGM